VNEKSLWMRSFESKHQGESALKENEDEEVVEEEETEETDPQEAKEEEMTEKIDLQEAKEDEVEEVDEVEEEEKEAVVDEVDSTLTLTLEAKAKKHQTSLTKAHSHLLQLRRKPKTIVLSDLQRTCLTSWANSKHTSLLTLFNRQQSLQR